MGFGFFFALNMALAQFHERIENDGAEYTDHDVVAKEHACAAGQAGERLGQGDAEQQRHADDRLTALVISDLAQGAQAGHD